MKTATILLVAWTLAGPMATAPAVADEKAVLRAMEQQRKAAEAEMRQQAQYEQKVMQQQQRMMQEQMKAQHRMMEQQQKAMQNQQKAAVQNQQKPPTGLPRNPTVASTPHITTTQTTRPVYHASRPYYAYGHAYYRTPYRTYRTMPSQVDPQTRALMRLKSSLDSVRMGNPATSPEQTAIKKALMGVVMVPKVPSIASLDTLSGHLANGLANRTSANAQTGPMALTLMGALNSTELANAELTEIMNEHHNALKVSKVRPSDVTPIMESLRTVSSQVRSRR